MITVILASALAGPIDCPDGRCVRPDIRIRVPGVRIDVAPLPRYVPPRPRFTPYRRPAVYRRGFFGKWKYKAKGWRW